MESFVAQVTYAGLELDMFGTPAISNASKFALSLATPHSTDHALCASHSEGWGPISQKRDFDLTPCFEQGVAIPLCLLFLIVSALPRIWQLVNVSASQGPKAVIGKKSQILLFVKLALLATAVASSVAALVLAGIGSMDVLRDPTVYATLIRVISLSTTVPLTYLNHNYTRRSSTILLTFYPIYLIISIIALRTSFTLLSEKHSPTGSTAQFAVNVVEAIVLFSAWILECFGVEVDEVVDDGYVHVGTSVKESPYATANIYSRLSFTWLTPLMKLGYTRSVVQEDMYDIDLSDQSETLGARLQQYWDRELANKKSPSLWRALGHSYGGPFAFAACLKIIQDILSFSQPQLLRMLLTFISEYRDGREDGVRPNPVRGFALSFAMFIAAIIQSAILHQYFQLCFVTGSRVRAGLVMVIYRKALVLSNDKKSVRGDIVNLMAVDASRMQDLCTYVLIMISGPFQIILAFVSLYKLLGWPAFVGVLVMIIAVPINTALARFLKTLQEKQMKNRDGRTRMMSELLNNIKSVKLYAWEDTFIKRILTLRNDHELKMLKKIGVVTAINTVFWSMVPLLVAFASFATAAFTNTTPLTSDLIFPCISLFMLLQFPLAMFANITSSMITAIVSVNRLTTFLQSDELAPESRAILAAAPKPTSSDSPSRSPSSSSSPTRSSTGQSVLSQGDLALDIKDGEFRWNQSSVEATLEGINFQVKMGELVGVLGRVGSGKSSLVSAAIGEMTKTEGEVNLYGTVAYAPQNPWIMSTTVRDNITFFHHFDPEFYELVLDACALRPDLALLKDGDMTEVGEKGITLSGGQRARISLARCVYARADLYLLDDVLAAVDAHVARHLFDRVIGPNGLLSQKARVVVTNSVSSVREYDSLVLLRRGIILESGTYESIMKMPNTELCKLITEFSSHSPGPSRSASGTTTPMITDSDSTLAGSTLTTSLKGKVQQALQRPAILSRSEQQQKYEESLAAKSSAFLKEQSEQGRVKMEVYTQYLEAASKIGVFIFIASILAQQGFTIWSNLTLRAWGEHNRDSRETRGAGPYILQYGLLIVAASASSLVAGITLWVYCAIHSARRLHDAMLHSVLRAPLRWFEQIPQGRILNLFSKDQNVVDEVLVRVFSSFFRTMSSVVGILIVLGASFPVFLIAVVPLAIVYQSFMIYYLATSRELKRLDAVSRSPIFSWFQESLGGLSTIRAFRLQPQFININEMRSDTNLQCYLPSTYVNRWLALRLEFLGSCIVLFAAILSVVTLVVSGKIDSGLVGLVLSYALSTTGSLNWVIRSASDVEQNIVSCERILTYIKVEPEAPFDIPETKPPQDWPQAGVVQLDSYSMRYRPDLDPVLHGISMTVKPGERIGICGRTGAGKSSLILGLLRINEADSGRILIDGVDISKIGLHDLRTAISIIPQEPQLFEGTIRQNVDVPGLNTDEEIWNALDQVHLKQYISSIGGLDAEVREGGTSLSSGQRQLICFARALIRHSRILVLDEATSAVDLETDNAIQDIIRGPQFAGVTMLTIAHRLNTIRESDRILVLDAGKVAELDTPEALLANEDSIFASLAVEAGLK